jgi:hypothetical protein
MNDYLKGCDIVPHLPKRQNRLEIIQWQLDICNSQAACAAVYSVIYNKILAKLNNRDFTPLRVTYDYLTASVMKQHSTYAIRKSLKWLINMGLILDCRKGRVRFLANAKPDNAYYVQLDWVQLSDLLLAHGYELPPAFKDREMLKAHLLKATSGLYSTPKPTREVCPPVARGELTKHTNSGAKPKSFRSVESNRHRRNMTKESKASLVKKTPNPLDGSRRPRGTFLSRRRTDSVSFVEEVVETNNQNLQLILQNKHLCDLLKTVGIYNLQSHEARKLLNAWSTGKLNAKHVYFMGRSSNPPQFDKIHDLISYFESVSIKDEEGVTVFDGLFEDVLFEQNTDKETWAQDLEVCINE